MKKIIALILFSAFAAVYAQSFQITYNGEPVPSPLDFMATVGDDDNELVVTITNTSEEPDTIYLSKRVVTEVPGSYNTFCIGICYDASVTTAPVPLILQPGENSDGHGFHFLYNPGGNEGTTTVDYTFTSGSFSTLMTVNYTYTAVGISSSDLRVNSFTAYPNPATSSVTIAYDLSGLYSANDTRLVITNLVGSKVAVRSLNGTSGKVSMDISNLDAGIYFYSIEANGQAVSTRKLIVK